MLKEAELKEAITQLKIEKNAVIMAHYYQEDVIQDIADVVGDSLALAQQAAQTKADIILLSGVYFMGETAKILSPEKKVLVPDVKAGCSLADSCPAEDFAAFKAKHPGHTVVTYVNTTAAVKALSDIVVTSTNAVGVINSIPSDQPILFGPDRNLGAYLQSLTGRKMFLWVGAVQLTEKFPFEKFFEFKKKNPEPLLVMADFIGSTAALLKYTQKEKHAQFIVATEAGILHQMRKASPSKTFIPAPPSDSSCACNDCEFMKLNTLEKIYLALKNERPEVLIDETVRRQAVIPIERMLDISSQLNL